RPVEQRGYPGVDALQRSRQIRGVHVHRPVQGPKGAKYSEVVVIESGVGRRAPDGGLPRVTVAVDEAGDDYVTGDVDHLGVARFEIWADGGDFVPLHENVPARENAQFPVHGDDVTTSSSLRSATVPSKTCHTIVHRRGYSGQGPH